MVDLSLTFLERLHPQRLLHKRIHRPQLPKRVACPHRGVSELVLRNAFNFLADLGQGTRRAEQAEERLQRDEGGAVHGREHDDENILHGLVRRDRLAVRAVAVHDPLDEVVTLFGPRATGGVSGLSSLEPGVYELGGLAAMKDF